MAAVSFSLSESVIVDSIRTLSRFNKLTEDECCNECLYLIQSTLIVRITAVFISAFAIADSFVHLMSGIYKASHLALAHFGYLNPSEYNLEEVSCHFQKAVFFAALTLIGPFLGIIQPNAFRYYWFSPERLEQLQRLILDVEAGHPETAWPQLQKWFDRGLMDDKLLFFRIFGQDTSKHYKTIRRLFSEAFYTPVPGQHNHDEWLTPAEMGQRMRIENDPQWIEQVFQQAVLYNLGFYFHGTRSENSLRSILRSKVEVHDLGAFVSTKLEPDYGPFYLAFQRNIEFLSLPSTKVPFRNGLVWIGFSEAIPVTEETLAYIGVSGKSQAECDAFAKRCKDWTGRDITVIPLNVNRRVL